MEGLEAFMSHLSWHNYLVIISFFAAIAGIALLLNSPKETNNDVEATNHSLMLMAFTYWLVYCVTFGLQKIICPDWELLITSVRLTSVLAYILTFACVLSLPLHQVATRQLD